MNWMRDPTAETSPVKRPGKGVRNLLTHRRSLSAVADYFRRFRRSDNHVAHFSAAFGEELDEFERALDRQLVGLLRNTLPSSIHAGHSDARGYTSGAVLGGSAGLAGGA